MISWLLNIIIKISIIRKSPSTEYVPHLNIYFILLCRKLSYEIEYKLIKLIEAKYIGTIYLSCNINELFNIVIYF